MKSLIFSIPHFPFLIYIFLFLINFPSFHGFETIWYASCGNVFKCGTITTIDYPFYGEDRPDGCGYPGLELDCDDDITTIDIMTVEYRVLDINQDTQILSIARDDLLEDICLEEFVNTTIDSRLFEYASEYMNLTFLYGCPRLSDRGMGQFKCDIDGIGYNNGYVQIGNHGPGRCHASVVVPIRNTTDFEGIDSLGKILASGFEIRYKLDNEVCNECKNSSGRCSFDQNLNGFKCLCANNDQSFGNNTCVGLRVDKQGDDDDDDDDGDEPFILHEGSQEPPVVDEAKPKLGKKKNKTPLGIGLGIAGAIAAGILVGWWIILCRRRRRRVAAAQTAHSAKAVTKEIVSDTSSKALISSGSSAFTNSIPSYPSPTLKSDLGRRSSYFGVQIFSYGELEEATDSFSESRELGDGGFGAVYYGVLSDGRVVAVKRLYEHNFKRMVQFMNEIEILAKLQHQNLVHLYGCTSKTSRDLLLVYEYIPNGTVADHLHGKLANSGQLSWPVRLNIAVETADALAYLHRKDIIHRDVKTNNILLDNEFHVKVADFGLSRLFPLDATHVSTAPQGTPGYVDPEYYQVYQLTEKSDVFSFGVVLIELISSLQAVDIDRHRQDINLGSMAVNKIQNDALHELVDPTLGFGTNSSIRRMISLVSELAFRCLQQEKDTRPSMEEVFETLRGIQYEELNIQKEEVVEIVVDDVALLKGNSDPPSPDKGLNISVPNSM